MARVDKEYIIKSVGKVKGELSNLIGVLNQIQMDIEYLLEDKELKDE